MADDDPDLATVERRLLTRQRLARYGGLFIVWPLILGLMFAANRRDRNKMRKAAVEICAANPPPCPGDHVEIARVDGKTPGTRRGYGLVLFRRSPDCGHEVEVYFSLSGNYEFRGSVDDPDVAARVEFTERRKQRYGPRLSVGKRLPCERADEL
jgi:hypothetical protein